MGNLPPRGRDVLLALALGSRRRVERRVLPDRRSGIDRRKIQLRVAKERRAAERRQVVRRQADEDEGPTLLEKARARTGRPRQSRSGEARGDGLR